MSMENKLKYINKSLKTLVIGEYHNCRFVVPIEYLVTSFLIFKTMNPERLKNKIIKNKVYVIFNFIIFIT